MTTDRRERCDRLHRKADKFERTAVQAFRSGDLRRATDRFERADALYIAIRRLPR